METHKSKKAKAHRQVQWYNLKDDKCLKCGGIIDLHFHHTDYEKNEGFTVCRKCHNEEHRLIKVAEYEKNIKQINLSNYF